MDSSLSHIYSKRGKEATPFSGKMGISEQQRVSLSSEERAKALPLNHAETASFCKGACLCGYRINRNLAFGAMTGRIRKLSKSYLTELLFFLPENCWREIEVSLKE